MGHPQSLRLPQLVKPPKLVKLPKLLKPLVFKLPKLINSQVLSKLRSFPSL